MDILAAIQWGTLPGWLPLILLVGAALVIPRRGGGGTAIQSLEAHVRVLEQQAKADAATIAELRARNGELRGRTDVTVAIEPVIEALKGHELRAQERHDGSLRVLDLIAKRIGPEPNGNGHHHEEGVAA